MYEILPIRRRCSSNASSGGVASRYRYLLKCVNCGCGRLNVCLRRACANLEESRRWRLPILAAALSGPSGTGSARLPPWLLCGCVVIKKVRKKKKTAMTFVVVVCLLLCGSCVLNSRSGVWICRSCWLKCSVDYFFVLGRVLDSNWNTFVV